MGLFKKTKWKPENIHFTQENGETTFYALLCIKWKPNATANHREYQPKDLQLVEAVVGAITLNELSWWKVVEKRKGTDKAAFYLYYYPFDWLRRTYPDRKVEDYCEDLEKITELFNWMVD